MSQVPVFTNGWFPKMIDSQLARCEGASHDAKALARAIMVAGALVAQSIDVASEELPGDLAGIVGAVEDVAGKVNRLADVLAGHGERLAAALYDLPTVCVPAVERAGAGGVETAVMPEAGEYRAAV